MKFSLILLCLVLIISIWNCASKKALVEEQPDTMIPELDGTYFWAIKPEVNIRSQNTVSAERLGKLNDGDSVLVVDNQSGWYRVLTTGMGKGWIRSDLLGPKKVSVFANAVDYVNYLKETENIDLFFDKNLYHRRIYISYPEDLYLSKDRVEERTRILVKDYQEQVYRGDVTARVLQPGSQDEYLTLEFKGKINPDIKLPVLPFGILKEVENSDPKAIMLTIQVSDSTGNNKILAAARNMVSVYSVSYSRVQLKFVSDNDICRMWLVEDQNGEDYKFDECPD